MQKCGLIIAGCMLSYALTHAASSNACGNGYVEKILSEKVYDEKILKFFLENKPGQTYANLTLRYVPPKMMERYVCIPDATAIMSSAELSADKFNGGDYISAIADFYRTISAYQSDNRFDRQFIALEGWFHMQTLAASLNIMKQKERDYSGDMMANGLLFDELTDDASAFGEYRDVIASLSQASLEARNRVTAITLRIFLATHAEHLKARFGKKLERYDATLAGALEESIAWYSDTVKKLKAH